VGGAQGAEIPASDEDRKRRSHAGPRPTCASAGDHGCHPPDHVGLMAHGSRRQRV